MINLEFFCGVYSPIPYLDSNGVQMFAIDIPYLCRVAILLVIIIYFLKGIFRFMNISR